MQARPFLRRFSELERAIPSVSQKMLIQQPRQLEVDGIVARIVHPQVPPKAEYHLTERASRSVPFLDKLLTWVEAAPADVRNRLIEGERLAG